MAKEFIIVSPDGFPFEMDKTYPTQETAKERLKEVIKERFSHQGYYSSPSHGRIPLNEVIDYCSVKELTADEIED
jgi:hypothetical protein